MLSEIMGELLVVVLVLLIIALIAIMLYKYRAEIKRFTIERDYGVDYRPKRSVILGRRVEDAQAALAQYTVDEAKREEEEARRQEEAAAEAEAQEVYSETLANKD